MRPDLKCLPEKPTGKTTGESANLFVALECSPQSVRAALAEARVGLAALAPCPEAAGTIELVLAEVLNNICEHAYRGAPGPVELSVRLEGEMLLFETRDHGVPMPNGRAPAGRRASLDRPLEDIPEGGFGWYLIRQLTTDLIYSRVGDRNDLSFRMRRDAQPI